MNELLASHKKLLSDALDCELIAKSASNPHKRAPFDKLAADLRSSERDIEIALASQKEGDD
jgi:hypothetical protein